MRRLCTLGWIANLIVILFFTTLAKAQYSCSSVFTQKTNTEKGQDLFIKLQALLTSKTSPTQMEQALIRAENEIFKMESFFGNYPAEHRQEIVRKKAESYAANEYCIVYNAPTKKIANEYTGEAKMISPFGIVDYPELVKYFESTRMSQIDASFFHNLKTAPYSNIHVPDGSNTYSFYIGQFNTTGNISEATGSTLRVNVRTNDAPTGIEHFLNEQNLDVEPFARLIQQTINNRQNIYELSRVSNGTKSKITMLAQRLMLDHYLARRDPNATFVLAATSERLAEYYKHWGLDVVTQFKAGPSNSTYFIMSANGQQITAALAQDMATR